MKGLFCALVSCLLLACSAERIQRLAQSEPVFQDIRGLVVDSTNMAYVLTYDNPSLLHEVNLNNLRLLRTAVLPFAWARSIVLDDVQRKLYIGFDNAPGSIPGTVLKFDLLTFAGAATFQTFHAARNLALDGNTNILYVATYPPITGVTSVIHKINATNFAVVDTIELPTAYRATSLVYDSSRYYLYVGNDASPPSISRLWGEPALQRMDVLTFPKGWQGTTTAVIDSNNQFAYFGLASPVGRIAQIDLSNFNWVNTISTAGAAFRTSAIDNVRGYTYWISDESPSTLYRVRLCDFSLYDVEAFLAADQIPTAIAIRPSTGVITVGTSCLNQLAPCTTYPNSLIKLQVTQPAVCPAQQVTPQSNNVYQNTVNMMFANMIPSPSCCPPPSFFSETPRIQQSCR